MLRRKQSPSIEEGFGFWTGLKKRSIRKELRQGYAEGMAENFDFVNRRIKIFLIPGGDSGLRDAGQLGHMINRPATGFPESFDSG